DPAGLRRVGLARRVCRGCRGRERLRVRRRGTRWANQSRGRRCSAPEGDRRNGLATRRGAALIVDYHMHLRNGREEVAHDTWSVDPFVAAARAAGVDEIGFTEHVYYFTQTRTLWTIPNKADRCVYDLDAYVEAGEHARERGLPAKL